MSPNTTPMHARVADAHACVGNMRTEVPVFAAMPCAMARSSPLTASSRCLPQGSRLRRLSRTAGRLQQGFAPGEMGFRERFCTATILNRRCPLWVKSRHRNRSAECPLYPRKRTSLRRSGTSVLCQYRNRCNHRRDAIEERVSPMPTSYVVICGGPSRRCSLRAS